MNRISGGLFNRSNQAQIKYLINCKFYSAIISRLFTGTGIPTNTSRVFHVETTWKRTFSCRFNMEYMWCVCKNVLLGFHHLMAWLRFLILWAFAFRGRDIWDTNLWYQEYDWLALACWDRDFILFGNDLDLMACLKRTNFRVYTFSRISRILVHFTKLNTCQICAKFIFCENKYTKKNMHKKC